MADIDGDTPSPLLLGPVYHVVGHELSASIPTFRQDLGDGRRQGGLAMVNVTCSVRDVSKE